MVHVGSVQSWIPSVRTYLLLLMLWWACFKAALKCRLLLDDVSHAMMILLFVPRSILPQIEDYSLTVYANQLRPGHVVVRTDCPIATQFSLKLTVGGAIVLVPIAALFSIGVRSVSDSIDVVHR